MCEQCYQVSTNLHLYYFCILKGKEWPNQKLQKKVVSEELYVFLDTSWGSPSLFKYLCSVNVTLFLSTDSDLSGITNGDSSSSSPSMYEFTYICMYVWYSTCIHACNCSRWYSMICIN